jgi:cellobiose-specific phosphotransferase system component IIB
MATLVLVCAAGVSGTFLARRMASALPDVSFLVSTEFALADVVQDADGVLVAPQVAVSLDVIRAIAAPRPVELLPAEALTPEGTLVAVDAVEAILQTITSAPEHQGTQDA